MNQTTDLNELLLQFPKEWDWGLPPFHSRDGYECYCIWNGEYSRNERPNFVQFGETPYLAASKALEEINVRAI